MNDEPQFIRRRFTIPESLDDELTTMAKNHYQGNVSLCLRQAIQDHKATLRGEGRLTLKRINQNVEHVDQEVTDLSETIETIARETRTLTEQQSELSTLPSKGQHANDAQRIQRALTDADSPLRIEDLIERLEMNPLAVNQVLGKLVDLGYVMKVSDDRERYCLAKANPKTKHQETR